MIKCYVGEKEVEFRPFRYPAGEVGYKIEETPRQIVCWFENSDDILLLGMLAQHFPNVTIYLPYMPFGREDRRVAPNASFGLELMAKLFSGDTLLSTYDPHSDTTLDLFVHAIPPTQEIEQTIREVSPDMILFPDAGAKKRYLENYQLRCPCKTAYGEKKRSSSTGEIVEYRLEGLDPSSNKILVIDDICDGGRTFIEVAKLLPNKELYLHVSHGIFSKGFDELKQYYRHIFTTNSYRGERDEKFVTEYRCL